MLLNAVASGVSDQLRLSQARFGCHCDASHRKFPKYVVKNHFASYRF
jgi:hypothetical protein